jgi:hypothetical protein
VIFLATLKYYNKETNQWEHVAGGGYGGSSVQSDWNQNDETAPDFIKNKPFWETGGDTLTWTAVAESELDPSKFAGDLLYSISDAIITLKDVSQGGKLVVVQEDIQEEFEITTETSVELSPGVYGIGDALICTSEDNLSFVTDDGEGGTMTIIFPKAGIYTAYYVTGMNFSITINGYTGFPVVKKIEEKYLPDTVATKDYVEQAIRDAISAGGSNIPSVEGVEF